MQRLTGASTCHSGEEGRREPLGQGLQSLPMRGEGKQPVCQFLLPLVCPRLPNSHVKSLPSRCFQGPFHTSWSQKPLLSSSLPIQASLLHSRQRSSHLSRDLAVDREPSVSLSRPGHSRTALGPASVEGAMRGPSDTEASIVTLLSPESSTDAPPPTVPFGAHLCRRFSMSLNPHAACKREHLFTCRYGHREHCGYTLPPSYRASTLEKQSSLDPVPVILELRLFSPWSTVSTPLPQWPFSS